ncbi:MAG: hypothetical protein K9L17_14130 [Clostridiales bacterium]|nr:hypothetical protein [Clostridiales bacterium]MCF8023808.1 hypothetical protein [Clostridiales bacterium]
MDEFACCHKWDECKEKSRCLRNDEFQNACYLAYNYRRGFNPFKQSDNQAKKPVTKEKKEVNLLDFMGGMV